MSIFKYYLILYFNFILYSIILAYDLSSVLDNFIIGTPKVICEETEVAMDIVTAKPFIGNIFVKGRAKDTSCRQSFSDSPNLKNGSSAYTLSLGKCGMQRLRSASPRGINFAVTLVVSFHPAGFITKNDKAFHLSCFYTEPEEIVTSSFEVSHLPPQELSDQMSMPSCRYSVHSSGWDGPQLSWANVGDTVYHVWECRGPELGILIKKCFVTDGDGDDHAVVDENGCSLDLGLIDEIIYADDGKMRAYAKSHVFKYADSNQLFFTCQIRMCQKQMDMCQGITPPKCSGQQKETKMKTKIIKQHNKDENKFKNEENEFVDLPESAQIEKVLVKESEADWSLDSGVVLEDNIKEDGKFVKGILKQKILKKEENSEKQGQNEEKKEEKGNKKEILKEGQKEEIKQKEEVKQENNETKERKNENKQEKESEKERIGYNEKKFNLNKNNNKKNETKQESIKNIEKKILEKREKIAEKEEEQDNGGEEEIDEGNDWSLIVKGRGRRGNFWTLITYTF
ncbi:ZP domain-containing protein [Meloidogyne graminicola]|uniref:ZP domain-containing protein n=1 Tax=Meloidogyne graminicola TaxID=189291 RepID=A0A8T0A0F0_9BILA|nr:ZP domain-containing protein [Meloidogyne graminicola]